MAKKMKDPDPAFFLLKLLEAECGKYAGIRGRLFRYLRIFVLLLHDFHADRCLIRASALSFTTILSLIPFLALAFAVLKGLGVHTTIESYIVEKFAAGSQDVVNRIIMYIDNTKVGSLGAIGLAALLFTVITLLGNIEESFNEIWGVRETRSFSRKFSDYLSVVVSAPILLLAATSITTSLQSQNVVKWLLNTEYVGDFLLFLFKLVPYLSIWMALFFLYIFIPNTRVSYRSALLGGVLAGTLWELAQWGYIHFQIGVAKYNAIYGTLSAIPVFMVWIYTSWLIVLFGVEIVHADQNRKTFLQDMHRYSLNYATREFTTLAILLTVAEAYHHERAPWSAENLARMLDLPVRTVEELLSELVDERYLVAAEEKKGRIYFPARSLEHMRIAEILEDLKNYGGCCVVQETGRIQDAILSLLAQVERCSVDNLAGLTVKDLVENLQNEASEEARLPADNSK